MPITKVAFFNKALRRFSHKNLVQAEDERSTEAEECRKGYEQAIRETLAAHDWNFARRTRVGSLLAETPANGYLYAYSYPSDCVKFRRIQKDIRTEPEPRFEIALNAAGNGRAIYADKEAAVLVYTQYIDNPLMFDDLFISAASWRLAAEIAGPITKDLKRAKDCRDQFTLELSGAVASNANEGVNVYTDHSPDWITARS
jgi:hypothetical protein